MPIKIDTSLYRTATSDEARKIQLEVLLAVDKFCKENEIKYFLYYGSLLGAARHKGFIPWDDDVDIAMLREDYDKFIASFHHENITALSLDNSENHPFYLTKIYRSDTVIIEDTGRNGYAYGVGIDLFPLDRIPKDPKIKKEMLSKIKLLMNLRRVRAIPFYKKRKLLKAFAVKTLYYLFGFLSPRKLMQKTEAIVKEYSVYESDCVADIMLPYGERSIAETEWFSNTVLVDFEDYKFSIPADYDKILTKIYGDYMTPPPKDKQIPRHDITIYIKK